MIMQNLAGLIERLRKENNLSDEQYELLKRQIPGAGERDFTLTDVEVKSQVNREGWVRTIVEGHLCPRCGYQNEILDHGESGECWRCGLRIEVLGNRVRCYSTEWYMEDIEGVSNDKI